MRIVSGRFRGQKLTAPEGDQVRPTSDRARSTLFNVLAHRFDGVLAGARVLDAFAGSGALGLEALSRGAHQVTFMERAPEPRAILKANVAACRAEAQTDIVSADATRPPRAKAPVTLAFLDPPYGDEGALGSLAALAQAGWFAPDALVCFESDARRAAPVFPPEFETLDERTQSRTRLTILRYTAGVSGQRHDG